jgi:RNA recognition motif-containing protein
MFSQFGKILDVVCLKTYRLRGQAWIVFADVAAATNALRTMQGFLFFDKPIVSAAARPQAVAAGAAARQACRAGSSSSPSNQLQHHQQCKGDPAANHILHHQHLTALELLSSPGVPVQQQRWLSSASPPPPPHTPWSCPSPYVHQASPHSQHPP